MTKKERFEKVIHYFQTERPVAETELEYGSPYELLVAVILSAQCTDKRVNLTTPAFFAAFPTSEVLAASSPEEVFPYIRSISYPNNKAKHLVGMAKVLVEEFNNIVPSDIDAPTTHIVRQEIQKNKERIRKEERETSTTTAP